MVLCFLWGRHGEEKTEIKVSHSQNKVPGITIIFNHRQGKKATKTREAQKND
jgi:hypothetical protein